MYAVLRLNSFDPAKLVVSADRLEEFDKLHAAQRAMSAASWSTWEPDAGSRSTCGRPNSTARRVCKSSGRRSGGCSVRSWPPRHSSSGPGQCSLQI
jgi:hypothetical protein